jgi:hypothetical protein
MEATRTYPPGVQFPSSSAQSLISDANACGSPKAIRNFLQQYEDLRDSRAEQKFTKLAVGCSALAAFSSLAPSLVTAAQKCSSTSPDNAAACGANLGAAVGALVGLTGIFFTIYAIYLSNINTDKFINQKDMELSRRFVQSFSTNPRRAKNIMSRYAKLSNMDREEVRNQLFSAYLSNPRPVRAQPPADQAALEVELV